MGFSQDRHEVTVIIGVPRSALYAAIVAATSPRVPWYSPCTCNKEIHLA